MELWLVKYGDSMRGTRRCKKKTIVKKIESLLESSLLFAIFDRQ